MDEGNLDFATYIATVDWVWFQIDLTDDGLNFCFDFFTVHFCFVRINPFVIVNPIQREIPINNINLKQHKNNFFFFFLLLFYYIYLYK